MTDVYTSVTIYWTIEMPVQINILYILYLLETATDYDESGGLHRDFLRGKYSINILSKAMHFC